MLIGKVKATSNNNWTTYNLDHPDQLFHLLRGKLIIAPVPLK